MRGMAVCYMRQKLSMHVERKKGKRSSVTSKMCETSAELARQQQDFPVHQNTTHHLYIKAACTPTAWCVLLLEGRKG